MTLTGNKFSRINCGEIQLFCRCYFAVAILKQLSMLENGNLSKKLNTAIRRTKKTTSIKNFKEEEDDSNLISPESNQGDKFSTINIDKANFGDNLTIEEKIMTIKNGPYQPNGPFKSAYPEDIFQAITINKRHLRALYCRDYGYVIRCN